MPRLVVHFLIVMFLHQGGNLMAETENEGERAVRRWLSTNAGVEALKVEFTQTRKLTSLKSVIRQRGVLWLDRRKGTKFRWQTGHPPRTIVTRVDDELLVMRTRSRQYEKSPAGKTRNSMAILARGFPQSWEEFQQKYQLMGVSSEGGRDRINVQPKGALAQGIRVLTFVTGSTNGILQSVGLTLRDGSSQQIVFDKVHTGPELNENIFDPDLTGYRATNFK